MVDSKLTQEHLDYFYEDVFFEMAQFGEIEEIYICINGGAHLRGNCYIKFAQETSATFVVDNCRGRYYDGRPIVAELGHAINFREVRCRLFVGGECTRQLYCNFMHLAEPSEKLKSKLFDWQRKFKGRQERRKKEQESKRQRLKI